MSLLTVCPYLACSRLLGSGEEAKEKGTQKVGWAGKRKRFPVFFFFFSFPPFYFRVCAFFNSANPTVSEPVTGSESVLGGFRSRSAPGGLN